MGIGKFLYLCLPKNWASSLLSQRLQTIGRKLVNFERTRSVYEMATLTKPNEHPGANPGSCWLKAKAKFFDLNTRGHFSSAGRATDL